jgi:hypothetical protein
MVTTAWLDPPQARRSGAEVARPVIGDVMVTPDPVPEGQQATIMVTATDPDTRQVSAEATAVDETGRVLRRSFTFRVSDALTYAVTVESGTVTQDPSDPSQFIWAPVDGA